MKGIILAGGRGSRLYPLTEAVSKQLLPVHGQPMVYYPLTTLISSGIREVLVITAREQRVLFENLLKDGNQFGITIQYAVQENPKGIAEALVIAESWLDGESCALILGDNLFSGSDLGLLQSRGETLTGAEIFGYRVAQPNAYGVVEFTNEGRVKSLEEKPAKPKSNFAIPGLYLFDSSAPSLARELTPSARGELEIVDVLKRYLKSGKLRATVLPRGSAWMDMGTPELLNDASNYVRSIEQRHGQKIGCPEEAALDHGFISKKDLAEWANVIGEGDYSRYLRSLLEAT